jgi:disulfide bond formation protein DsbB
MTFSTMSTFFAIAALFANVATVGLVVVGIAGRRPGVSPFEFLRGATLWLAAGVATGAMLGSLYLSEIAHLIPCRYCWYQRIAMYPLAIVLLIAAFRKDGFIRLYAATLATIGVVIAVYHRFIQAFPDLDAGSCAATGPACSAALILKFGFVSIPYMSASAFLLILTLLWADRANDKISQTRIEPGTEAT